MIRSFARSSAVAAMCGASLLVLFASCSDGSDALDDACAVIVECGAESSVGSCVDRIAGQPLSCVQCIVEAGCAYPDECSPRWSSCRLPLSLLGE